ncbi:ABC transporter substrate-binding protein [Proteinivorax tanatarense]|uniref:ABC transporter substrate-binding protein n=1 Tax=Proteinivorax tanatarense TaxID=1260629 RepID=A0AAU7VJB9_9FIRM
MNKKLTTFILLMSMLGLLFMGGCQGAGDKDEDVSMEIESTEFPLTITDSYDNEVTLEEKPERIITVAPSITETIFALGQEDYLVGRTDFCDYPNEVGQIESIGTLQEPNIEKIVELEPDVVVASTHFSEDVYNKLTELDIKVVLLNPQDSFEGVYHVIEKLGKILDANKEAEELVSEMEETIEQVTEKVQDQPNPRIYYVVGYGEHGDFTAGGDTFINEIIEMVSAENVASEIEGWNYSLERLVEQDPDMLIVSKHNNAKEGIMEASGYKELTAVKEERVYEIDNNLLDRQGPRIAEGLKQLAKIVHPDVFK